MSVAKQMRSTSSAAKAKKVVGKKSLSSKNKIEGNQLQTSDLISSSKRKSKTTSGDLFVVDSTKKSSKQRAKTTRSSSGKGHSSSSKPLPIRKSFSSDMTKGRHLVIVESPAKAKTIKGFLGSHVDVQASYGHVSDLPSKTLGVDIKRGFEPTYEIAPEKRKVIAELKKRAKEADGVWLATDEDREGEAIGWHVANALGLDVSTTPRIVFHEITKTALQEAVANPRSLDMQLVDAQQARRILDRIVGFSISPILWTKIKRGLSAGRVQSVAVKLIVEREREIQAFSPEESWKVFADIKYQTASLSIELAKIGGQVPDLQSISHIERLLTLYGIPQDRISGELLRVQKKALDSHSEQKDALSLTFTIGGEFTLTDTVVKQGKKHPSAPFITSSLQQEASRRFGRSVKQVMSVAQRLYEGGYITYMRTDSTNLSAMAIAAAKDYIVRSFGTKYHQVRQYASKSKNAQEAHEAIRPSYIDRTPEKSGLGGQEALLYRLIWQRTIASQMASAETEQTIYYFTPTMFPGILAIDTILHHQWKTQGEIITFPGFLALYEKAGADKKQSSIESSGEEGGNDVDDESLDGETSQRVLPKIPLNTICPATQIEAKQYFSKPPARYTESALVKALETRGIGRPSTYAPTIATIQERGYVEKKEDKKLYPLEIAFLVNDYLEKYFSQLMNYKFTANLEDELDAIAEGKEGWKEMMRRFYEGDTSAHGSAKVIGFENNLQEAKKGEKTVMQVGKKCPQCGDGNLIYKFTKFGKFIGCDRFPECSYTEKTQEENDVLAPLKEKYEGKPCPEGGTLVVKMGRFGPFLTSSLYPQIKWISSIPDEHLEALQDQYGGKPCPECGEGKLVVKKARRGNYFLACNRYPDCKHAENIPGENAKAYKRVVKKK